MSEKWASLELISFHHTTTKGTSQGNDTSISFDRFLTLLYVLHIIWSMRLPGKSS